MASKEKYYRNKDLFNNEEIETIPFKNAQEAWFWFVQAQEAKNAGARCAAGQGECPRPCEPIDILKILDSLYRKRRLLRDHLLVLRHYGRRRFPPDEHRHREMRAYEIWTEALERIGVVLERKGFVKTSWSGVVEQWRISSSFLEGASIQ